MRVALIADLHSNYPALEAVAKEITKEAPDEIVCLGDLVGYNAEPSETIALLKTLTRAVVAGNHDRDLAKTFKGNGAQSSTRLAQTWTGDRLDAAERSFLEELPALRLVPGAYVAVHGCYLNDTHYTGYVTSTMLEENLKAIAAKRNWPRLAFCGHTHVPMCGYLDDGVVTECPVGETATWPRDAQAMIVNPGAVGQPRDGNPEAAYAIVDLSRHEVRFRRTPYDVERTIRAIRAAGLPADLCDRLREGR